MQALSVPPARSPLLLMISFHRPIKLVLETLYSEINSGIVSAVIKKQKLFC